MTIDRSLRRLALILPTALLSACGALTDPSNGFGDRQSRNVELFDLSQTLLPTPPADMPPSGSAVYEGMLSATPRFASNPDAFQPLVLGRATVDVDFGAAGTFSGFAMGFVDGDDELVPGAVTMSGTITEATLVGDLMGNVTIGGEIFAATGTLSGGFKGPDAELIDADVTGDLTSASDSGTFVGDLRVERTSCEGC